MNVKLHPRARERLPEQGATQAEVIAAVQAGETFPAKFAVCEMRAANTILE